MVVMGTAVFSKEPGHVFDYVSACFDFGGRLPRSVQPDGLAVLDWLSARPVSPLVANARIDVTERNDAYEVRADLPGAAKDDIAVEIEGSRVSVSAKVDTKSERKDGDKLIYSERTYESYSRAFELPQRSIRLPPWPSSRTAC